ncbi:RNA recognition motif domain-containing protein [Aspergillus homomorphus CBS 101889]|uniref:RRM domain-containing protein n=1 Tax=Aspergillus homomorphus (strain CBS 101889) TaxID=1450537 RepID=A0A395HZ77_ASPHC|nr:hypothetical protein BO97DRAFT_424172 [Aspergillus homomorphus CBS 101889]RAL12997.1 hypothetical protein BO97DRAFT_424172 [Aspergillus homomorphus CBS 101889]
MPAHQAPSWGPGYWGQPGQGRWQPGPGYWRPAQVAVPSTWPGYHWVHRPMGEPAPVMASFPPRRPAATGIGITDDNSQERLPKENTLFVGNLKDNVDQGQLIRDLKAVFQQWSIVWVKVRMDKKARRGRKQGLSAAFITFPTAVLAQEFLKGGRKLDLYGRALRLEPVKSDNHHPAAPSTTRSNITFTPNVVQAPNAEVYRALLEAGIAERMREAEGRRSRVPRNGSEGSQ